MKKWYIINVRSGYEKKVIYQLKKIIKEFCEEKKIPFLDSDIIIAEQKEKIIDKKTKLFTGKFKYKNLYPGYIFVNIVFTDEIWYKIKNIEWVINVAGCDKNKIPVSISDEDMEPILKRIGCVDNSMYLRYNIGDLVKIINGPLAGSEGKITYIDKDKGSCVIETMFFGRAIPTDVDFVNIEKENNKK